MGGLYERVVPAPRDIGRTPLSWANDADADWLARLALDHTLGAVSLRRALFLDLETTGLGGGTGNVPFLVGAATFGADGNARLVQWWLRDLDDEPVMLERLRPIMEGAELFVSYNGKSFDLPVLRNRFLMNGLDAPPGRPHLDLLHLARRVHKGRPFRKSLTDLEREVLGFVRSHDVAGEEVARRYLAYLRHRDATSLGEVVVHNERDLWSLVALMGRYGAPLDRLALEDLPWLARCVRRAGDLPRAACVAREAVARGGGLEALRVQGEVAKARGAKDQALNAFEAAERLAVALRDDSVAGTVALAEIRFELCKLYEHHRRDPHAALRLLERSAAGAWAEPAAATAHRRARLARKIATASTTAPRRSGRARLRRPADPLASERRLS
ncbi:MAG: ribonuclease H-like domain-containing protein [Myxococcota bacterium]